jgi:hypothetical protein
MLMQGTAAPNTQHTAHEPMNKGGGGRTGETAGDEGSLAGV